MSLSHNDEVKDQLIPTVQAQDDVAFQRLDSNSLQRLRVSSNDHCNNKDIESQLIAVTKYVTTKTLLKRISLIGCYRTSPKLFPLAIVSYMLYDIIDTTIGRSGSPFCSAFNICIITFQVLSTLLYIFAYYSIDKEFINHVCDVLQNVLPHQTQALNLIKREVLQCVLLLLIPPYISGLVILPFLNQLESGNKGYLWVINAASTNALDVFRYLPPILHISLVRMYFNVFRIELEQLRTKYDIHSRNPYIIMQLQNKQNQWANDYSCSGCSCSRKKNGSGTNKRSYRIRSYNSLINKENTLTAVTRLVVSHDEFITDFENINRKYRYFVRKCRNWILCYFLINVFAFIMLLVAVFDAAFDHGSKCNKFKPSIKWSIYIDYVHFLLEFGAFWAGWLFLILPLCVNQSCLQEFAFDMRIRCVHESASEKNAIDNYLRTLIKEDSPFAIAGVLPTYYHLGLLLQFVIITIGYELIDPIYK